MRVWLIKIGEPVPSDGPNERLLRTGLVAERLADRGHDVVWWTSDFDHARKRPRRSADHAVRLRDNYTIEFLHAPPYQRNVSLRRFINHRVVASKFGSRAQQAPAPDVIVSAFPTPELCDAATAYGRERSIPVVIDARDMWPDIIVDRFPAPLRPIGRLAVTPMRRAAVRGFAGAAAIYAISEEFLNWGLAVAGRPRRPDDAVFSLAYNAAEPAPAEVRRAREFWDAHGVPENGDEIIACFFANIGVPEKFTLERVIAAARLCEQRGLRVRFVLCGDGDGLPHFRRLAEECSTVVFPGWIGIAEVWTLLRRSHVGLLAYADRPDLRASIPNKVAEYFSAGLPVLTSVGGLVAELVQRQRCGAVFHTPAELADALAAVTAPGVLETYAANARRQYEERFVADAVYGRMIEHLESLVVRTRSDTRSVATAKGS